jgi:hypothetical protein
VGQLWPKEERESEKHGARLHPKDLLRKLIEQNPKVSKEELFKLWSGSVDDDPRYLTAVKEYWFSNASLLWSKQG